MSSTIARPVEANPSTHFHAPVPSCEGCLVSSVALDQKATGAFEPEPPRRAEEQLDQPLLFASALQLVVPPLLESSSFFSSSLSSSVANASSGVPSPEMASSWSSCSALASTCHISSTSTSLPLSSPFLPQPQPKRPSISPLQSLDTGRFVDERSNINRALKICGFSTSRSAPTFPLSPVSPSLKELRLPEADMAMPMTPPVTPLASTDSLPLPPSPRSEQSILPPFSPPTDPQPRRQRLRCHLDEFTPTWVRGQGLDKQGYCSLCEDESETTVGRWLSLKDGSYWYHRQFVHGISSVSGRPFARPLETRCVASDSGLSKIEGLCGTCSSWHTYETFRSTTNSSPLQPMQASRTLWYRHAHECHSQTPITRSTPPPRPVTVAPNTPFVPVSQIVATR